MSEYLEVAEALSLLSGPAVLALVLLLLSMGKLRFEREWQRQQEEKRFWRDIALRALNIGEAVVRRRDP